MTQQELISKIQIQLVRAGETLKIDGLWGPKTSAAIDKYTLGVGLVKKTVRPKPVTPVKTVPPVKKGSDIIPFAVQAGVRLKTHGTYAGRWPKGAVVHYTAGNDAKGSALALVKRAAQDDFAYLCIDSDGTLIQGHPVSQWGYHAGKSAWSGYSGGLNDEAIGIEICSPGRLEKGKDGVLRTYYGATVKEEDARYVEEKFHGCPTGWYKKFTPAQEATLARTLKWLKENDPSNVFRYENVVGHHECAGLKGLGFWRKQDPGGSLSMSMDDLRAKLKGLS